MARPRNLTPTVHLRTKPIGDGQHSQYLEIYRPSLSGKGKRSYEFLGRAYYLSGNKKQQDAARMVAAEKIRAERERELVNRHHGIGVIAEGLDRGMRILDYWQKIGDRNALHRRARQWLELYDRDATFRTVSAAWFERFGEFMLQAVTASKGKGSALPTTLSRRNSRADKGTTMPVMNRNSARDNMQTVRSVLRRAMIDELIGVPLYERLVGVLREPKWKKQPVQILCLDIDELRALHRTPCRQPITKQAFLFAVFAGGLRRSDIEQLRWRDIDRAKCELTLRHRKTGNVKTTQFPRHALSLLPDYTGENDLVFPMGTRTVAGRALRQWGQDAGIRKPLHFHVSRHTHATLMLEFGADLKTVSESLDHASITTTVRYVHIVEQRKREAVERLPGLDDPARDTES